jgi:hypothetical protein
MARLDHPFPPIDESAQPPSFEDLTRFRQGLVDMLGQTRQHMSSLGSLLFRGEAMLSAFDKQFQEEQGSNVSTTEERDGFYERMESLPVQPAISLKSRSQVMAGTTGHAFP